MKSSKSSKAIPLTSNLKSLVCIFVVRLRIFLLSVKDFRSLKIPCMQKIIDLGRSLFLYKKSMTECPSIIGPTICLYAPKVDVAERIFAHNNESKVVFLDFLFETAAADDFITLLVISALSIRCPSLMNL